MSETTETQTRCAPEPPSGRRCALHGLPLYPPGRCALGRPPTSPHPSATYVGCRECGSWMQQLRRCTNVACLDEVLGPHHHVGAAPEDARAIDRALAVGLLRTIQGAGAEESESNILYVMCSLGAARCDERSRHPQIQPHPRPQEARPRRQCMTPECEATTNPPFRYCPDCYQRMVESEQCSTKTDAEHARDVREGHEVIDAMAGVTPRPDNAMPYSPNEPAFVAKDRDRWRAKAIAAENELAAQRSAKPEVWHYMPRPGVAECGADYANMSKTAALDNVTCLVCLRKFVNELLVAPDAAEPERPRSETPMANQDECQQALLDVRAETIEMCAKRLEEVADLAETIHEESTYRNAAATCRALATVPEKSATKEGQDIK